MFCFGSGSAGATAHLGAGGHGAGRAADVDALIPFDAQPLHILHNLLGRRRGVALLVGILNAKLELTVRFSSQKPIKQSGGHDARLPGPPHKLLQQSVHNDLACTDCHAGISLDDLQPDVDRPHGEGPEPVDCGGCHEEAAEVYVKHGRMELGKDPDTPVCWSCHGTHEINLPRTCKACHTDMNLVRKHDVLRDAPIRLYESSVHGQASKKGLYVSATCNDCHSATDPDGQRTAHRILGAGDPESPVYHFNIPDTCGQCHEAITKDYWEGIHGRLVKRGHVDAPVCSHCHGEHGIIKADDARSPVSAARVAVATCAPCHESELLNEKYGIPAGRLRSYVDSYHGLKSKAGDVHVANCASCHGAHRILPHTDPSSSIHPDNLQETCGECHPGISSELAHTPIHGPPHQDHAPKAVRGPHDAQ